MLKRTRSPESHVRQEQLAEPDVLDEMFEMLVERNPEYAKTRYECLAALRERFGGERVYIKRKSITIGLATELLSKFNGRNPVEIGRRLGISPATVYRLLKQPGKAKA